MSEFPLVVIYKFHPVGQGLFASGALRMGMSRLRPWNRDERVLFRWVFDCGTSSSQSLLDRQIKELIEECSERRVLNLVGISHFDRDHISGLLKLANAFEIELLLLPYMSLGERLVLAFSQGIENGDRLFEFFINPAAFLSRIDGARINRIVFVPPSEGTVPEDEGDQPEGAPALDDLRLSYRIEAIEKLTEDQRLDLTEGHRQSQDFAGLLAPRERLKLSNFWQFVPYNDQGLAGQAKPAFMEKVASLRGVLLDRTNRTRQKEALDLLRGAYDSCFGDSSKARNAISLFLYGGMTSRCAWLTDFFHLEVEHYSSSCGRQRTICGGHSMSILYTGDGSLNTSERLDGLQTYLGSFCNSRNGVAVFQVMHHGAESSWMPGVASVFQPQVSVFSSDPSGCRYRHPHANVLRDFWGYGPVQACTRFGITVAIETFY